MQTLWAELGADGDGGVYAKSFHRLPQAAESAGKDKFTIAVVELTFEGNELISAKQIKRIKPPQ